MDTTPPQQEMTNQADSSYEEADNGLRRPRSFKVWWLLILALIALWLWISWFYGRSPFSSQTTISPEETTQEIPQSVLDSLTAPTNAPESDIPQSVLDSLTAPTDSPSAPDLNTP